MVETVKQEKTESVTSLEIVETFHSNATSQTGSEGTSLKQEVEDDGKAVAEDSGNGNQSDTDDGFVVYAKHGEQDVVEIDKKVLS